MSRLAPRIENSGTILYILGRFPMVPTECCWQPNMVFGAPALHIKTLSHHSQTPVWTGGVSRLAPVWTGGCPDWRQDRKFGAHFLYTWWIPDGPNLVLLAAKHGFRDCRTLCMDFVTPLLYASLDTPPCPDWRPKFQIRSDLTYITGKFAWFRKGN